jgi:hypothetical protein
MSRVIEAFIKFNFVIKYKKESEMPADFLRRNATDAVGICSVELKLEHNKMNFINQ